MHPHPAQTGLPAQQGITDDTTTPGRKTMKHILIATTAAVLLAGTAASAQQVLRLGHNISTSSPYHLAAEHFAGLVAERTEGRLSVQVFPAGALGNERDMIEGAQIGSIDMVVTSSAATGPFVPEMRVLDIPFLFRDLAHARAVLDGEIGEDLLGAMTERSLIGLAWGDIGFRHMTGPRALDTVAALQGVKLRSQGNPIHLAAYRALGFEPSVVGFNELYAALQTGVVEANEQPLSIHVASRFYEVQSHLTLTGHLMATALFVVSQDTWDGLSAADQEIVRQAARDSIPVMREATDAQDEAALGTLRERGMTIVETFDRDGFVEALAPAFAEFGTELGEENIRRIADFQ
jgi:TRAP-type transport system periplasmic protein